MDINIGDLVAHPFKGPEEILGMVIDWKPHRGEYQVRWFRSRDGAEWDSWVMQYPLRVWKNKLDACVAAW